jgi:hypothetical protein
VRYAFTAWHVVNETAEVPPAYIARMLALPALLAASVATASAQPSPADRANIALSTAIVARVGDALWPGWSKTPFAIDLITQDGPVLLNVSRPFTPPPFPRDLEATITLDSGPLIVIGQPQFTSSKSPMRWSVTLLHEHFHEWQYSWPHYYDAIRALDLSRGTKGGMWMLNYPFPYGDPRIDAAYTQLANRLADALQAIGTARFHDAAKRYLSSRAAFKSLLAPDDYKYFAFQCWQEGIARYTEIRVAQLAALAHRSDPSFLTDAQATGLMHTAGETYWSVLQRLRTIPLRADKRADFYAVGAGEALLLDQLAPGWQRRYLDRAMDLRAFMPQ